MKKLRKICAIILFVVLVLSLSAPVFVSADSKPCGIYTVSVTKSGSTSSHMLSGPNGSYPPKPSTYHRYKLANGSAAPGSVAGSSFGSYWKGTGTNPGSYTCTMAYTMYNSVKVQEGNT